MKNIFENWNSFVSESHSKEDEKELKKVSDELKGASKMHKGQADRIDKILDSTDDEELEEGKKKNCGCGQDPCITYGVQAEAQEAEEELEESELDERCQKGYKTHETRKTKEMYGKTYRNCVKAEELELDEKKKKKKKKGNKICDKGIAWAKRTFDTYPSAYANLAASKYCKDPNYGKGRGKDSKNESLELEDFLVDFLSESELEEGELKRWLNQKWKRIDSKGNIAGECGTSDDKKNPDRCLPASKASSLSKSERAATAKKKKDAQKSGKDSGYISF